MTAVPVAVSVRDDITEGPLAFPAYVSDPMSFGMYSQFSRSHTSCGDADGRAHARQTAVTPPALSHGD